MTTTRVRYLGGPSLLLEYGRTRFLIDPTFDGAGDYPIGTRVLTKTADAVVGADELPPVDAVLLSHDQHPDNLDSAGRNYVKRAPLVLSTPAARARLGDPVRGLARWETTRVGDVTVTAVPALHGPPGSEPLVGEVTGFVIEAAELPRVYVSGDNASLELVGDIASRYAPVDVAVLFAGAARTALLGEANLTLGSAEAAEAAQLLQARHVVPVHFEDWAHFTQGRDTIAAAFTAAGLADRLHLLDRGDWADFAAVPSA
ncbi:MAG TPA: MBL fold metallo-hydrolase [Jatrophihabitans sp.]|nr:MBL fold metallo-hydrolase [Jatrophihabitans sp.]